MSAGTHTNTHRHTAETSRVSSQSGRKDFYYWRLSTVSVVKRFSRSALVTFIFSFRGQQSGSNLWGGRKIKAAARNT